MDDTGARQERARDFERFLTFIDAVVAIAVTLLVLPLVDLVTKLDAGGSVAGLLKGNAGTIGAFFLSFLVIARLWLVQHELLRHVVATNRLLTNLLLLWALTIVLLPFPTALVSGPGQAGDQAATKIIYVGTMAVGSAVLGFAALVIAGNDALRVSVEAPDPRREFGACATFLMALVVMLVLPSTSYFPLLLLALSDRLSRVLPTGLFPDRLPRT